MEKDTVQLQKELKALQIQIDELKVSVRKQHTTIETSFDGFWMLDSQGNFLEVNDSYCEMTGYTRDEFLNMSIDDFEVLESEKGIQEHIQKALQNGSDRFESKHRCKNGEIIDLEISASFLPEYDGGQFAVFIQKRTVQKNIELTLIQREHETSELLNRIFNAFALFESVFDESGNFVSYKFAYINKAYEKMTGVKNDEVKGKTVHEVWPETEPEWIKRYGEVALSGENQEFELYHNPTKHLYHCQAYRPFNTKEKFCVILEDITEEKNIGVKIQESEKKYKEIFENILDAFYEITLEGIILEMSPSIYNISNKKYTREQLIGKSFSDFYKKPDQRNEVLELLHKQGYINDYNIDFKNIDGTIVPCSISAKIQFDENGNPLKIIGSLRNVSERKKAEKLILIAKAEAEESEKKLRTMYENSPLGIFRSTPEGKILSANPAFFEIYGLKDITELQQIPAQNYYTDINDRNHMLEVLKNKGIIKDHITKERKRDHTEIWIKCNYSAVKDLHNTIVYIDGILEDITHKVEAEDALRNSEQKFKAFFNSNPTAAFVWEYTNNDFKLIEVNDSAQTLTKKNAKKFIGLMASAIYSDIPEMLSKLHECYSSKSILEFEKNYKSRGTGDFDWIVFRTVFLEPNIIILFADSITERKKTETELKQSEVKFRALFEQAGGYCMILDPNTPDGIPLIIDANEAACKKHGYTHQEFIGRPISDIDNEEGKKLVKARTASIMTGKPFYVENVHVHKDGTPFHVAINAKRIDIEGHPSLIFTTEYDISELKETEKKLIAAKEKAEESDRLKTEFLNNMSHEIRTPLNGILGFSKLLCKDNITLEKKNSFSNVIQDSGERLTRVIEDIVDISMIESNQLEIIQSKINISDLLHSLFLKYQSLKLLLLKPELKLKLNCGIDQTLLIVSDHIRLSQVIDNLVTNAIKYCDRGTIEIGCSMIENRSLKIYVKDEGPGIPEDQTHKLFKRFTYIETKKLREGTGIGLAISKGIIELLGGAIGYRPNKPMGAIFGFSIPITSNAQGKVELPEKQFTKEKLSQKLIYVAEDDLVSTQYLTEILSETEFEMKYSSNGIELIDLIEERIPDLILLDIKMPQMNGFDALTQIRKQHPNLPIIAQTAHAMNNEKMRIQEAGFDDYIAKPIVHEELIKIIKKHLK